MTKGNGNTDATDFLCETISAADLDENFNRPAYEHNIAHTAAQTPPKAPTPPPSTLHYPPVPASNRLPPPGVDNTLVHVLDKWIPIKVHTTFLTYIDYLGIVIDMWSTKFTFSNAVEMSDDEWKRPMPCFLGGFIVH